MAQHGLIVIAGPPHAHCMGMCMALREQMRDILVAVPSASEMSISCADDALSTIHADVPMMPTMELMELSGHHLHYELPELNYHEPIGFEKRGRRPGQNSKPLYHRQGGHRKC